MIRGWWNVLRASLCLMGVVHAGYNRDDEAEYLRNFDAHVAASFAEADESEILQQQHCRSSTAPAFRPGPVVTVVPPEGTSVVSSEEAQKQCHPSYLCVIPPGVVLEVTQPLVVGALEVRGRLVWTDGTQDGDEACLCAGYLVVSGPEASWTMNLRGSNKRAWIYVRNNGANHPRLGPRVFGGELGASIDVRGRTLRRTWTLLDEPLEKGSTTMRLLHDPTQMGWREGDRIGVAPTEERSQGTGRVFRIGAIGPDGTVVLDAPSQHLYKADFLPSPPSLLAAEPNNNDDDAADNPMPPILMSAEVVHLSRSIVITGDDFEHVPCDPFLGEESAGCTCTPYRSHCTMGLHTVLAGTDGSLRVSHTRIEKCGQRGILGRYCLHLHQMRECPDCLVDGNALEYGHNRGVVIHGTHRALVQRNVLWNVRGAGFYVEDGNEMHNRLSYNVAVCPFPIEDPLQHGCTIPGTQNAPSDSRQNQAAFYLRSSTNDMIGNRAANSRNGMFAEPGADGLARGRLCRQETAIGRWEGNTFHGHARFGTYPIKLYPQETDRSLDTNGLNLDSSTCTGFDSKGNTRGKPAAILHHLDYDNVFVGQYEAGDIQYKGHASIRNKNLMYWKETKNFDDGCSAHVSRSYYAHGNLALPDQATVILEDSVLENVSLEANQHCGVGSTGFLCMPQYILHNIEWIRSGRNHRLGESATRAGLWAGEEDDYHDDGSDEPWFQFQDGDTNYGGIFSLSPAHVPGTSSPFPPGYTSLVSERFGYLLEAPNHLCSASYHLGVGHRYHHGILCKVPLRSLRLFTRGLVDDGSAPLLKVEVWFESKGVTSHNVFRPTVSELYPFHQIGGPGQTNKQGYAFPVIPSLDVSYRLSLTSTDPQTLSSQDKTIPWDWVVEFSDPVVGNRWGEERVQLELAGRPCPMLVSDHHDRRFVYSGPSFMEDPDAWGRHGACVIGDVPPKMPAISCSAHSSFSPGASECPELCGEVDCSSLNAYCDCRMAVCTCLPGFWGDGCSADLCSETCGDARRCVAKYLGDATVPIRDGAHACVGPQDDRRLSKKQETSGYKCSLRFGVSLISPLWVAASLLFAGIV